MRKWQTVVALVKRGWQLWRDRSRKPSREQLAYNAYLHALTSIKEVAVAQSNVVGDMANMVGQMLEMMKVPAAPAAPSPTATDLWAEGERRRLANQGIQVPALDHKLKWLASEIDQL